MVTDKAIQIGLPSFALTLRGTGDLVPAVAPCAHSPPWWVQTNLGKSLLVLKSPILVEILSFIWRWSRLLAPLPVGRILGQGPSETFHPGYTHSRSRHWVGLGWKILRNSHPVKRYWVRAGWKMPGELLTQWKGMGVLGRGGGGAAKWKKKKKKKKKTTKEFLEIRWKMLRSLHCRGLNGLGWVVK